MGDRSQNGFKITVRIDLSFESPATRRVYTIVHVSLVCIYVAMYENINKSKKTFIIRQAGPLFFLFLL